MSVSTIPTTVDPADVEIVQELEPDVLAFMAAIEKVQPALKRLVDANYAGAEWVADELENAGNLERSLQEFNAGAGDQAALDYYRIIRKAMKDLRASQSELYQRKLQP